jgi:hypothetical protein
LDGAGSPGAGDDQSFLLVDGVRCRHALDYAARDLRKRGWHAYLESCDMSGRFDRPIVHLNQNQLHKVASKSRIVVLGLVFPSATAIGWLHCKGE